MEVVFSILPFPQLLLEKSFHLSPMQALLSDYNQSRTPEEWSDELTRVGNSEGYVVYGMEHFKERSIASVQHEFVWLRIRRRGTRNPRPEELRSPTEDRPLYLIKVQRSIPHNTIPSRLGLRGTASDTITVLRPRSEPANAVSLHNVRWDPPEHPPSLRSVSALILKVNRLMPRYHLSTASCYSFSRAVTEGIRIYANGVANHLQPPFLFTRSRFLGCLPMPMKMAQDVAQKAAQMTADESAGRGDVPQVSIPSTGLSYYTPMLSPEPSLLQSAGVGTLSIRA